MQEATIHRQTPFKVGERTLYKSTSEVQEKKKKKKSAHMFTANLTPLKLRLRMTVDV